MKQLYKVHYEVGVILVLMSNVSMTLARKSEVSVWLAVCTVVTVDCDGAVGSRDGTEPALGRRNH